MRAWRAALTAPLPGGNEAARVAQEMRLARQGAALRRQLVQRVRERAVPADPAAAEEVRRAGWAGRSGR